jgi:steroid 5-alpha reductase family enzyme
MMIDWSAFLYSGAALLLVALVFWVVSLLRNDVSIVDSLWSLMFLLAAVVYAALSGENGPRTAIVLALVAIWALRLSIYITWRNHGQPEDYRYKEIRANNEPGFRYKSLYIVFVLQALLAWIISLPLAAAISGQAEMGILDYAGIALWVLGVFFEAVGDLQLSRFRKDPANRGKVLDTGLWRYTRHPNYFGNFTLWWGFYLVALSAGGWWTIISPLLMTFLLLKVSGVALLEKDIGSRRPKYQSYIRRTNAFFPGFPRNDKGAL